MDIDFISPGYTGRSSAVDAQNMVNLYPEVDSDGKTIALVGTPGTSVFTATAGQVVRGMWSLNNTMYVVASSSFYSITAAGVVSASLGELFTTTGIVQMADNGLAPTGGNQIFITDGSVYSYLYNVNTGVFSYVNDTNGTGCKITIAVSGGALSGAQTINAAGSSYAVGDILVVAGGTGGLVKVATLSGSGVANVTVLAGGSGYTNATTQTTSASNPGFPVLGASDVTFLGGYFIIAVGGGSSSFAVSNLYDGSTWNALNTAAMSFQPQPLNEVFNYNNDLWLFGPLGFEVWYNTGTGYPPFQRYSNGFGHHGAVSGATVARSSNGLYWLSKSPEGGYHLKQATGIGSVKTVSTVPIEYQWGTYSQYSLLNSFAYIYEDNGHIFYVLTFPADSAGGTPLNGATWVFDETTGIWHQRSSFYVTSNKMVPATVNRHIGNSYCRFNGQNYLGDFLSGEIYLLREDIYTDAGDPIIRIRTGKTLIDEFKNIVYHKFQLDMEVGVGDGTSGQGGNPVAYLDWSEDYGKTWGNKLAAPIGKAGDYLRRVIWRQLGMSRIRTPRVTISDPVKVVITKALMETTKGRN